MKFFTHYLGLSFFGLTLVACSQGASPQLQGGTEAGNPYELRAVIGSVPPYGDFCKVDEIEAATPGEIIEIDIKQDCSFTGKLKVGSRYGMKLIDDDEVLAPVLFGSDQNNATPYLLVPPPVEIPLDLGLIGVESSDGGPFGWPENIEEIFEELLEQEQAGDGPETQSQTEASRMEMSYDTVSKILHQMNEMDAEEDEKEYKFSDDGMYEAMQHVGGSLKAIEQQEPERELSEQRIEAVIKADSNLPELQEPAEEPARAAPTVNKAARAKNFKVIGPVEDDDD